MCITLSVSPVYRLWSEVPFPCWLYRILGVVAAGLATCYSDAQQSKPSNTAVQGDGGGNGSESEFQFRFTQNRVALIVLHRHFWESAKGSPEPPPKCYWVLWSQLVEILFREFHEIQRIEF